MSDDDGVATISPREQIAFRWCEKLQRGLRPTEILPLHAWLHDPENRNSFLGYLAITAHIQRHAVHRLRKSARRRRLGLALCTILTFSIAWFAANIIGRA
jgi:hypothetical protein